MEQKKCVWAGGHGGLRLEAYSDGTAAARSGGGTLIAAVSAVYPDVDAVRFCSVVDVLRGYPANAAERQMLGDALRAARRAALEGAGG